jgi:hypothetical protein
MWLWGLRCDYGDGDVDMGMAMLLVDSDMALLIANMWL